MNEKENLSTTIYGLHPLIEAITSGKTIEKIFLQKDLKGSNYYELSRLISEHRIPTQKVPIEKLKRLTKKNHQGVFAFISPIAFCKLENLLPQIYEAGKNPLLLILDRITDVRNFGAIVRTAGAMGVDAVVIPAKGASLINSDAVKASAGAIFKVPVCKEIDLRSTLNFLKNSGVCLIAASEKGKNFLYNEDFSAPIAILLGNEENGISLEYLALSNKSVKIPMPEKINSLNVSVAAGIILYEVLRQRLTL